MKNRLKGRKGITLIALVITIIVLLILAGVSIAAVLGESGVIKKADEAVDITRYKTAEEKVNLAVIGAMVDDAEMKIEELKKELQLQGGSTESTTFPAEAQMDGFTFKVSANGLVTKKEDGEDSGESEEEVQEQLVENLINNNLVIDWEDDGHAGFWNKEIKVHDYVFKNSPKSIEAIYVDEGTPEYEAVNDFCENKIDYEELSKYNLPKQDILDNYKEVVIYEALYAKSTLKIKLNNTGELYAIATGEEAMELIKKGTVCLIFNFENGVQNKDRFKLDIQIYCISAGTLIEVEEDEEDEKGKKKKKRKKKKIEDLTYNDRIIVWNFDEGKFDTAKPLWLMKKKETTEYNLLRFSDGSELKTIKQHRIFNKELGKFTYPMTDETPIGTTTFNVEGKEVKLISKEVIKENVEYYNLITYYHMNAFANGILTSCRFNNLYKIEDMKFVKDNRVKVSKDKYKNIPDKYFYGLRLEEQPEAVNRENDDIYAKSIEEHIQKVYIANEK